MATLPLVAIHLFVLTVDSPTRWVGGLALGVPLFVLLRITFRTGMTLTPPALVVDQPLWRWTVPRGDLVDVDVQGRLVLTTTRNRIGPADFSPSLLGALTGEREVLAAVADLRAWAEASGPRASGPDRPRGVSLSVLPAVVELLVVVVPWQLLNLLLR